MLGVTQGVDAFAPLPGVKSNCEPYAIPSTSKLSSTSHNDSYPDGSPHLPHILYHPHPSWPHWCHHPW